MSKLAAAAKTSLDFSRKARIGVGTDGGQTDPDRRMTRLAVCGASGGAGVNWDAAYPGVTKMSIADIEASPKSKTSRVIPKNKIRAPRKSGSAAVGKQNPKAVEVETRVTKQERVLTLLSRPAGASIEEIMQATDWQQHSVRGFLAGTVKKKLGFTLKSSKDEDESRRYRIETRRDR